MKGIIQLLVIGLFWATSIAQAQDGNFVAKDVKSLASQMAEILDYPASRLIVTDESIRYVEKTKGQVIRVFGMESNDGTFAATGIAIAKRGALLKPSLEERCKEHIAKGSTSIRRFDLNRGGYGYAGLGIAGPGGSEELLIATWPERGIDLQIKITIPREGLAVNESTAVYYALVSSDEQVLSAKLIDAMGRVADYVDNADIRSGGELKGEVKKAIMEPVINEEGVLQKSKNEGKTFPQHQKAKSSASSKWPFIVVGIALLIILVIVLRAAKRKGKGGESKKPESR